MKLFASFATVLVAVIMLIVPVVGGSGSELNAPTVADSGSASPRLASITTPINIAEHDSIAIESEVVIAEPIVVAEPATVTAVQPAIASPEAPWESLELMAVPRTMPPLPESGCVNSSSYSTTGAPSATSAGGVAGTTSDDLSSFAAQYNAIRAANCLNSVTRFIYDSCMELRLFWMAESPSPNPADAWGHIGSVRIDGVPSVGCDGNLAGGSGNTGVTVATKWWDSTSHRASLYRPGTSTAGVCIAFAMTHGGNGDPYSFTRAAARWTTC
jgi:uncharacterized protein YkwD